MVRMRTRWNPGLYLKSNLPDTQKVGSIVRIEANERANHSPDDRGVGSRWERGTANSHDKSRPEQHRSNVPGPNPFLHYPMGYL